MTSSLASISSLSAAFVVGIVVAYLFQSQRIERTEQAVQELRSAMAAFAGDAQQRRALEDLKASQEIVGLVLSAQRNEVPDSAVGSQLREHLERKVKALKGAPAPSDKALSAAAATAIEGAERTLDDIKWTY